MSKRMARWPKHLEERIEAAGFYNLSELGRMFGRSRRAMHYYGQTKKWLGVPRMHGGQKVYSLAIAEIFFRKTVSRQQIDRAIQTARTDAHLSIAANLRKLRDVEWREALAAQGIENFKGPAEASL